MNRHLFIHVIPARLRRGVVLGAVAGLALGFARAEAPRYDENQVKAAYLFNFTRFVEWPTNSFAEAETPLIIGILGDDPFREALEKTVRGEKVKGHPLAVRSSRKIEDLKSCHVIFVDKTQKPQMQQILATLRDCPVLTVGEIDGFAQRGGIINMIKQEKRIGFEINNEAARRQGIKIGSQLTELGTCVKDDSP